MHVCYNDTNSNWIRIKGITITTTSSITIASSSSSSSSRVGDMLRQSAEEEADPSQCERERSANGRVCHTNMNTNYTNQCHYYFYLVVGVAVPAAVCR